MSCYINQDIQNCLYILNEVSKFYIADYTSSIEVNHDSDTDKIIDIYTDLDWIEIDFNSISIQTDYSITNELYSTAVGITISEISNELTIYLNERRKFFILFIDKNDNCWVDGVMSHDNQYRFNNINFEISNENNNLSFDLIKTSPYNIKQIDNNYFTFNNL
jgi:hypothetical protein